MLYALFRALLFRLPPEQAHRAALRALHAMVAMPGGAAALRALTAASHPVRVLGLDFANPVGLAAGFDKNAEHVAVLAALGFGFIEVGSVTARPWPGNPTPRLFRLPADRALINRMGLNNQGAEAVAARLGAPHAVPLFVNVAKTPDPALEGAAAIDDYAETVRRLAPYADAVVLNVSCPNSGDGRTFEEPAALDPLLVAALAARGAGGPPLLVKISPDLDRGLLREVVEVAEAHGVDGFTATNTTVHREGLRTPPGRLSAIGRGGLSGVPLHPRALSTVAALRALTARPIVGVGGVDGPDTARALLDAGAQLVQLYTGFIYRGPTVVRRIVKGLVPPQKRVVNPTPEGPTTGTQAASSAGSSANQAQAAAAPTAAPTPNKT